MAEQSSHQNTKLEWAGLILGIVAFTSAFIPYVNNITWALGGVGLIIAIAGLMKAEAKKNKTKPAVGLVLSLFSGSIGIFMSKMYAPMLAAAVIATERVA